MSVSLKRTLRVGASAIAMVLLTIGTLWAHDMFLRPAELFVAENSRTLVRLLNGTFSTSENSITRDRLRDISVVSPSGRVRVDTSLWTVTGDTSTFTLQAGGAGTYVLGASTKPRILEMSGKDFNAYLRDDGIPDELAWRRQKGLLNEKSVERYHKHVKALVQVGSTSSDGFSTVLGYPAEIVPLQNPYTLTPGASLQLRLLLNGEPLPNQYVLYGGRTAREGRIAQRAARSNPEGIVTIRLAQAGTWFVKFIHMQRIEGDPERANHESTWATLVFGVRQKLEDRR